MGRRVTIVIPGEPIGWGRPTPVARLNAAGEPFVMMVTQEQTRAAKNAVRAAFRHKYPEHHPWTGPVLLRFTAVFAVPKTFSKELKEAAARGVLYATKKPDKDNIEKLIKDALNGVVYCDDQQVMGGGIKRYGSPPRVEISFESLDDDAVPPTPGQRRAEKALQGTLPLKAKTPQKATPAKTNNSHTTSAREAPDLSRWSPRQRALIEAALEREERARRKWRP